jgi:hypothetical protein
MTDQPHTRKLIYSLWNELTELEATREQPDALATLRFPLIEHQFLTRTGRCRGCHRDWRRSWKLWRPGFPCHEGGLGVRLLLVMPVGHLETTLRIMKTPAGPCG